MRIRQVIVGAALALGVLAALMPAAAGASLSWSAFDLTSTANSTGGPIIAGRPAAFRDPGNGQLITFADTPSGHLVEFAGDGSGLVASYDISGLAGGATIAGDPTPILDPVSGHVLVVADSGNNHLIQFDRSPDGSWRAYDLTSFTSGTQITGNPMPVLDPQTRHLLVVADSPSGHLIEFDRTPTGSWSPFDLSNAVGGTVISGSPTAIVDPQSDDLDVVADSPDGHLLQWDRIASSFAWHVFDQTANAGAPIAGDPAPIVDPQDDYLLVLAHGPGGHMILFDRTAQGFVWGYIDLTSLTGVPIIGNPVPAVDPQTGALVVFTELASNHLAEFFPRGRRLVGGRPDRDHVRAHDRGGSWGDQESRQRR